MDEFLLRLKNIIKRAEGSLPQNDQVITIGCYKLDYGKLLLYHENKFTRITELEAKILLYLSDNRNKIIKRKEILTAIWGTDDYFTGRSFDVFLSRIRKYLWEDKRIHIISIRNVGIEFNVA